MDSGEGSGGKTARKESGKLASLTAYRARWILPVDSRPLENGILVVAAGRIVAVQQQWPGPVTDLGNVALIPGLVNCHTHLEFSELAQPLTPQLPFTDWIRSVIRYRQEHPEVAHTAIGRGLTESLQSGVTLLGDIATAGWSWHDYAGVTPRPQLVVFQELLGLSPARVQEQALRGLQHLAESPRGETLTVGLSPHAPYSTHPKLFQIALEHAAPPSAPVAVHLAETAAELELLREGTGEFRDFLASLGLWQDGLFGGRTPADWLQQLAEHPRGLVIHGNYLSQSELAILAREPHVTLVYCPRTHAAFDHPPHPWLDLLAIGGSVALGTDSRASNPDLSLWNELQFLASRDPDLPQLSLLKLATLAGARALGRLHDCGSLTVGKRADVAVVALHDPAFQDPRFDLLSPGNQITNTMLAGEWTGNNP